MRVLADPQLLERISLLSDRPDLQVKMTLESILVSPGCNILSLLSSALFLALCRGCVEPSHPSAEWRPEQRTLVWEHQQQPIGRSSEPLAGAAAPALRDAPHHLQPVS